jgi:hypothetical protein
MHDGGNRTPCDTADVRTGYQRSLVLAAVAAAVVAILFLAFGLVAGSGQ